MLIAIVGTGPSLFDHVEEIRSYPAVMTCSKALQWLLERNVTPTYHVDVDPGEHKVPRRVSPDVQYFLGNSVASSYRAMVPNINPIARSGTQAGDTALIVAHGLGYRDLHCYGFDGDVGHIRTKEPVADVEFLGKQYKTNENLLGSIYCFEEACRSLPDVKVTVHGNGLLRAYLDRKYGSKVP